MLFQHLPRLAPLVMLKKSDPELFKLKIEDMKLDRESHDAVKQLRAAKGDAQTKEAKKIAGEKTIAAGLAPGSRFMATAKTAGLDQTLAGAGPYTVFVPDDAAFAAAPAGTFDAKPENRSQLTGVVTNLILQGTVLTEDIDKLIDRGIAVPGAVYDQSRGSAQWRSWRLSSQ